MKIVKRRLLWIIEVFIWLLILFSVSSGIIFAKYNYKKNFDTYHIFLPDIDGLIVGSPVKFMGIHIGYVNQLDITGEDIYVKFLITDTSVKIPHGSIATVEFSGLGGSKSLELYPPTPGQKECCKIIESQSPKRIHDSLGLLNDMFESAIEIAYDVSHFMDKIGMIKGTTQQKQIQQQQNKIGKGIPIGKVLENSNDWLDKAQKQCDKINENLKNKKVGKNGSYGKNQ